MIQVLIVDDEKLWNGGDKISSCHGGGEWNIRSFNGRSALQIRKMRETDLLLTDIKMPHMLRPGLGLLQRQKKWLRAFSL